MSGPIDPETNPVACDKGTMCRHASRVPGTARHVHPKIEIHTDIGNPGPEFPLTEEPAMPEVNAWARVSGLGPDATDSMKFTWTATLRYNAHGVKHALPEYTVAHPPIPPRILRAYEVFTPQFSSLQGGDLTITVETKFGKTKLSARTHKLRVVGKNPTFQVLSPEIPNNTLRRIARHESKVRQFLSHTNDGTTGRHPLWSEDNLGGVGLFQITYPLTDPQASITPCIKGKCLPQHCPAHAKHPTQAQIWNWKENLAAAKILLDHKLALAKNYPESVRTSHHFKKLVEQFNHHRTHHKKPPLTITLPDFESGNFDNNLQEAELDAIRGYNGWAGSDHFGLPKHEYEVPIDKQTNLLIVDESTGIIKWRPIPASERLQGVGDPNYVANVLAEKLF